MGHPRWELAGRETGKRNLPQEMGHPRWDLAGRETGKRNLPQEMGLPRWELAGRKTGKRNLPQEMDIQDGNWQVGRREEEFNTGDGTSKMGTGR